MMGNRGIVPLDLWPMETTVDIRKTVKTLTQDTPRSQIKVGGTATVRGDWLVQVEEAGLGEDGRLHCKGHVISRPLCAETLVRGETHPQIFWIAY